MTEQEAIRGSVEHHRKNLQALQKMTEEFKRRGHAFCSDDKPIAYFNSGHCALCKEYLPDCTNCPLYKIGEECDNDNSTWRKLSYSETKEEAIEAEKNMIRVLESLVVERMETMTKEEMRRKIMNLKNGWDKEADDIVQELKEYCKKDKYSIILWNGYANGKNYGFFYIFKGAPASIDLRWCELSGAEIYFRFYSQCEKMDAFKNTLLWILEHSDLATMVGKEINAEIESRTYKVKVLGEMD